MSPIYDYECECGFEIEKEVPYDAIAVCDECGKEMKRMPVAVKHHTWNCSTDGAMPKGKK